MDMTYEQKKLTSQILVGVLIVGFIITQIWEQTLTLEQIALLAGVFLGVLAKFSIPYVLKTHEGTMTPFDVRYVWTGLFTFVYMMPIGLLLAEQLAPIALPTFAIVFLGVVLGIGSNWTTEKMVQVAYLLKGLYSVYGLQTAIGTIEKEMGVASEEPITPEPEPIEEPPLEPEPEPDEEPTLMPSFSVEGKDTIEGQESGEISLVEDPEPKEELQYDNPWDPSNL